MSSSPSQAGKHRASKARRAPKAALKTSLTLSSMAVVATGFAVGSGALSLERRRRARLAADQRGRPRCGRRRHRRVPARPTGASEQAEADVAAAESDRSQTPVTRSDSRAKADPLKKDTLSLGAGNTMSRTEDLSDEDPRVIARALLVELRLERGPVRLPRLALDPRVATGTRSADNPNSSAYGIPQALPGSKMASAGADWATNPVTQIKWGLGYIQDRYGSPCSAWGHSQSPRLLLIFYPRDSARTARDDARSAARASSSSRARGRSRGASLRSQDRVASLPPLPLRAGCSTGDEDRRVAGVLARPAVLRR